MAYQIFNNLVTTLPLYTNNTLNSITSIAQVPSTAILSVAASDEAKLGVAIDTSTDYALLVLTPLVQIASNLTVTVTDLAHNVTTTLTVSIIADPSVPTLTINTSEATFVSQAVPGA